MISHSLSYDSAISHETKGRPFGIEALRPIQLSKSNTLDSISKGRRALTTSEWKNLLLRSTGLEPSALNERAKDAILLKLGL